MTQDTDQRPYLVQAEGGRFCVVDPEGRVVIACGDAHNAEHYAVLMNQAYQRGFKDGLRLQKQRDRKPSD